MTGASVIAEGAARWLRLAATPIFASMAVLSTLGGSPMDRICGMGSGAPLSGMLPMYVLMSLFHSPPWLQLIAERIQGVHLRLVLSRWGVRSHGS